MRKIILPAALAILSASAFATPEVVEDELLGAEPEISNLKNGNRVANMRLATEKNWKKPDGSWVNDNNRWWENDPVLATSYAMLALEFASGLTK